MFHEARSDWSTSNGAVRLWFPWQDGDITGLLLLEYCMLLCSQYTKHFALHRLSTQPDNSNFGLNKVAPLQASSV